MATDIAEQEQLEALQQWWDDNGKSIVIGVVVALLSFGGWNWWKNDQYAKAERASTAYMEIMELAEKTDNSAQIAPLQLAVDELEKDYPGTVYATYSQLYIAKQLVDNGDLNQAVKQLQSVLSSKPKPSLVPLVTLRLAQLEYAQDQYEQALQTLGAGEPASFSVPYQSLRGDIFLAQGDVDQARAAYQAALQGVDQGASYNQRQILEIKLNDLAVSDSAQVVEAIDVQAQTIEPDDTSSSAELNRSSLEPVGEAIHEEPINEEPLNDEPINDEPINDEPMDGDTSELTPVEKVPAQVTGQQNESPATNAAPVGDTGAPTSATDTEN